MITVVEGEGGAAANTAADASSRNTAGARGLGSCMAGLSWKCIGGKPHRRVAALPRRDYARGPGCSQSTFAARPGPRPLRRTPQHTPPARLPYYWLFEKSGASSCVARHFFL